MARILTSELIGKIGILTVSADFGTALDLSLAAGNIAIINGIEIVVGPATAPSATQQTNGTLGVALTSEGTPASLGTGMSGASEEVPIVGAGIGLLFMYDYDTVFQVSTNGGFSFPAKGKGIDYRGLDFRNRPWTTEIPEFLGQINDTGTDVDITMTLFYQVGILEPKDFGERGEGQVPFGQRIVRTVNVPAGGGQVVYYALN